MRRKLVWILLLTVSSLLNHQTAHARHKKRNPRTEVDLNSVAEPKDQEVCFSPDSPCDLKLIQMIRSAKKSIDMAVYAINRDSLVHHLILASKKMPVRIVVDRRQSKGERSLVPLMIKAGVKLKYGRQRGVMHNKFTIVDGKMLETGSFNYTNHASESNHENQVYLSNPTIVEKFKLEFENLWENGFPT